MRLEHSAVDFEKRKPLASCDEMIYLNCSGAPHESNEAKATMNDNTVKLDNDNIIQTSLADDFTSKKIKKKIFCFRNTESLLIFILNLSDLTSLDQKCTYLQGPYGDIINLNQCESICDFDDDKIHTINDIVPEPENVNSIETTMTGNFASTKKKSNFELAFILTFIHLTDYIIPPESNFTNSESMDDSMDAVAGRLDVDDRSDSYTQMLHLPGTLKTQKNLFCFKLIIRLLLM